MMQPAPPAHPQAVACAAAEDGRATPARAGSGGVLASAAANGRASETRGDHTGGASRVRSRGSPPVGLGLPKRSASAQKENVRALCPVTGRPLSPPQAGAIRMRHAARLPWSPPAAGGIVMAGGASPRKRARTGCRAPERGAIPGRCVYAATFRGSAFPATATGGLRPRPCVCRPFQGLQRTRHGFGAVIPQGMSTGALPARRAAANDPQRKGLSGNGI